MMFLFPLLGLFGLFGASGSSNTTTTTSSSQLDTDASVDDTPDTDTDIDTAPDTAPDTDTAPDADQPQTPQGDFGTVPIFLVDTQSDEVIMELTDGISLDGAMINNPNLSIVYIPPSGTNIGSVTFNYGNGAVIQTESFSPYPLFGDAGGNDYLAPEGDALFIDAGTYPLQIEVFDEARGEGTLIARESLSITVSEPVVSEDPTSEDDTPDVVDDTPADDDTPVDDTPEDPPADDDTPVVDDEFGSIGGGNVDDIDGPDQPGESGSGAETDPVAVSGRIDVVGGRVTTLEAPQGDVASVEILSDVANGHVTVNEDNSFALVLTNTDYIGNQSFTYKVTYTNGTSSTEQIDMKLVAGTQQAGWATGESHYVLATDENDKVIVETGENHTTVYVSGSNSAWSLQDIANAENMDVSEVTGEWLAAHGGYGQSEDMAMAEDAVIPLWRELNPRDSVSSNHLLFERGYEYEINNRQILERQVSGEDELNPILIGAWGEGDKPYLENGYYQDYGGQNVVFQDIHFDGFKWQGDGVNLMLDNITVTGKPLELQHIEGVTIRNSDIVDVHLEESRNGGDWEGSQDRESGLFGNFNDGILLEGVFLDLNAWEIGYDPINSSGDDGQPPSIYSHNVYFGDDNTDVTIRDTISMRGASIGILNRSGGFMEDNAVIDNNIGIAVLGGNYKGQDFVDNYTLLTDNLVTSAAHKEGEFTTGRPFALSNGGIDSTLIDNIVTHLANPNDPSELEYKNLTHGGQSGQDQLYYDDTIVWNWKGADPTSRLTEKNAEDLDADILNQTTIQNFTAQLLGQNEATIPELAEYLRAQEAGEIPTTVDADVIIRYFQEGFGIDFEERSAGTTLRFEPSDLGDGVRWDNRLNWDTEDLPGEIFASDSVDLGGNHVVYGSNTTIDTLDIGPDGILSAYGGKLTTTGGITGDDAAVLNIEKAGQIWTEGGDASALDITLDGGRFVNTGAMSGASLTAKDGSAILASDNAEFDLESGDVLEVHGDAKVGFDGDEGGLALLDLHEGSTVLFSSDDGQLAEISEFRSGVFGEDEPDVASGIDLGNASLEIDLDGISGNAIDLMSADELIGLFDAASISGLGSRNAEVVIDYETDTVTLELSNGSGNVSITTVGEEDDVSNGSMEVWNALTSGQGVVSDTDADMDEEDDLADAA